MGKVLKADGSVTDAFVEFDPSASQPETWESFRLGMTAATIALFSSSGNYVNFFSDVIETFIEDSSTFGRVWDGASTSLTPPLAEGWQDIEFHWAEFGNAEFYVNGSLIWSVLSSTIASGPVSLIQLACQNSSIHTSDVVFYFDNFKMGTTRGGTDLGADDFESGSLSFWTTTGGDVSIVDDPFPSSSDPDFTFSVGGIHIDTGDLAGVYYIDHLDHDTTTRLQTFRPENLSFELNIRNPDTVDYEISLSAKDINGDPVVSSHDFVGAWRTCWQFRCGDIVISAGPHSMVNGSYGDDFMKVSGVSWLGYLNRRFFPFDPRHTPNYATSHINDFIIGSPPQGLAYEVQNVDASVIVDALWQVIFGLTDSMPLTYDIASLSVNVPHFSLALGDVTMFLSILQTLSEYDPGFDYWIGPVTKKLRLASPYRFGTPAAIVAGGATGTGIKQIFTNDATLLAEPNATNMLSLDFTNTGPEGTHIFGIGAGLGGNQLGIALGLSTNEDAFWRLDYDYEAGDVKNYQMLEAMARKQFSLGLQPVHEIPIVVDPGYIPNFWTNVRAGVAVWIKLDLGFHQIDSPQRITKMSGSLGNEGNVQVTLDHDQIYDVDPSVGDYEG